MSSLKIVLGLACASLAVSFVQAVYEGQQQLGGPGIPDDFPGMPYDFDWAVLDESYGNDFGQSEQSDGDVVQGEYYVLLPDGRRQIVKYTSGRETGFVADVQYEGEASFDSPNGDGGPGLPGPGIRGPGIIPSVPRHRNGLAYQAPPPGYDN